MPVERFTLVKINITRSQNHDLGESQEAIQEQHAKEDASVRGGKREEDFSVSHSIDLPSFF